MVRIAAVIILLVLFPLWSFGQQLLNKKVDFIANGISLEESLFQLMDQSGVSLSFSNEIIPEKTIRAEFQQQPLRRVLRVLFEDTNLKFRTVGQQVLIFEEIPPLPPKRFTISGYLVDEATQERLIGATVVDQSSKLGTATNQYGFFSLSLPQGSTKLSLSFIGYEPLTVTIDLSSDQVVTLSLKSNLILQTIEVVGRSSDLNDNIEGGIANYLDPKLTELLPGLGGEADLLRTAYLLPGVQTGTDGIGGMFVRGGGAGQNLVLIDDVPVYNIYHAAGLLSVFNTHAVRSAKLLKGGFPARYGGRLSSVLDIRTKDGNARDWSAQADIGMLTGRFSAEGPVWKDKSSVFVSGRLSYLDWYFNPISEQWKENRGENGATSYQYYDLNAKINYTFSKNDRIYLSFYSGKDKYENYGQFGNTISLLDLTRDEIIFFRSEQAYKEALTWGNTVSSLRWNHLFGNKLFANLTLTYSKLAVEINYKETDRLLRFEPAAELFDLLNVGQFYSGIDDIGGKLDFDFVPSPRHYVRFGMGATRRSFFPGALSFSGISEEINIEGSVVNDPIYSNEKFFYLEDEMNFGDRWLINAGLRLEVLDVQSKNYSVLQPRLFVSYKASENISFSASLSRMSQFLHLLSRSGIALPTDLWVSATAKIGPQKAWQGTLGSDFQLGNGMNLSVEGYYKKLDNLINYTEGANVLSNWEENITIGEGFAYGTELLLSRRMGATTGWIGYTLSWVDRQFDLINGGRPYPFKFDRRHDFKIVLNHRVNKWCNLSANWVLSSGFAFSLPFERYIFQDPGSPQDPVIIEDFDAINKYRMPYYHRLDVGAHFTFKGEKIEQQLHLGVYNVYNRQNPLYYNLRTNIINRNNALEVVKQFVEAPLLPILPSVSYTVKF